MLSLSHSVRLFRRKLPASLALFAFLYFLSACIHFSSRRTSTEATTSPYDSRNPYQCDTILKSGRYNDYSSASPTSWQPEGCVMRNYNKLDDLNLCLNPGDQIIFYGDSTARQIYWAFVNTLDKHSQEQSSHVTQIDGITLRLLWDPFFNSSEPIRQIATQGNDAAPISQDARAQNQNPAYTPKTYLYATTGLSQALNDDPDWILSNYQRAIDGFTSLMEARMDNSFEAVYFAPPMVPFFPLLNETRRDKITITAALRSMIAYADGIFGYARDPNTGKGTAKGPHASLGAGAGATYKSAKLANPVEGDIEVSVHYVPVFNEIGGGENHRALYGEDGIVYANQAPFLQRDILLNHMCNYKTFQTLKRRKHLTAVKGVPFYPNTATCCTPYEHESSLPPLGFFTLLLLLVAIGAFFQLAQNSGTVFSAPLFSALKPALVIVGGIGVVACYAYYADRTHHVNKVVRTFSLFELLVLLHMLAGLIFFTVRLVPNPGYTRLQQYPADDDDSSHALPSPVSAQTTHQSIFTHASSVHMRSRSDGLGEKVSRAFENKPTAEVRPLQDSSYCLSLPFLQEFKGLATALLLIVDISGIDTIRSYYEGETLARLMYSFWLFGSISEFCAECYSLQSNARSSFRYYAYKLTKTVLLPLLLSAALDLWPVVHDPTSVPSFLAYFIRPQNYAMAISSIFWISFSYAAISINTVISNHVRYPQARFKIQALFVCGLGWLVYIWLRQSKVTTVTQTVATVTNDRGETETYQTDAESTTRYTELSKIILLDYWDAFFAVFFSWYSHSMVYAPATSANLAKIKGVVQWAAAASTLICIYTVFVNPATPKDLAEESGAIYTRKIHALITLVLIISYMVFRLSFLVSSATEEEEDTAKVPSSSLSEEPYAGGNYFAAARTRVVYKFSGPCLALSSFSYELLLLRRHVFLSGDMTTRLHILPTGTIQSPTTARVMGIDLGLGLDSALPEKSVGYAVQLFAAQWLRQTANFALVSLLFVAAAKAASSVWEYCTHDDESASQGAIGLDTSLDSGGSGWAWLSTKGSKGAAEE